ncbi:MAG: MotA/TolQ/ExbB proton channel family protein [Thermoanaerobaculia bacterium]
MLLRSIFLLVQLEGLSRPGILQMFSELGPMGWLVAGTLIGLSLGSWTIMISKFFQFRRAEVHTHKFLDVFRHSQRFSEVQSMTDRLGSSPLVGLFRSGHVELDVQVKALAHEQAAGQEQVYRIKSLDALERTLRRAMTVEITQLSRGTGFLATTAAASPFIGLFGTVWGIMIAFREIAVTGSTSLVAVAPGIAEALINTALGLAAAIPALMAYNYFSYRIRQYRGEMSDFTLEFINLAERNFT